jgi:hypothetical protein
MHDFEILLPLAAARTFVRSPAALQAMLDNNNVKKRQRNTQQLDLNMINLNKTQLLSIGQLDKMNIAGKKKNKICLFGKII